MNTLIIYDNSGYAYVNISGSYRVPEGGVQFVEIVIPEGKVFKGMDTTIVPHVPIFEDIPISPLEKLQADIDYLAMMGGITL